MRDAIANPFTPGYGALPKVFAGREEEFRDLEVMAQRTRRGVYEQARRIQGVRGIGKTVLLGEYAQWLREGGWWTISLTVSPGRGLLAALARELGGTVAAQSAGERVVKTTLAVLRTIAAVGSRFGGPGWHLEFQGRAVDAGPASGDAVEDVRRLLVDVALLARARGTGVVLLLDEAQLADTAELAPLLYALQDAQKHVIEERDPVSRRVERTVPPLGVVLAGLPNLPDAIARAAATSMTRSKAVVLGPLPEGAVREALPAFTRPLGVEWDGRALDGIVELIQGYPYFLHVFGSHAWLAGESDVITTRDVEQGARAAAASVATFYDERLLTLTELQRAVLDAVAALPPEGRTSEAIARGVGRTSSSTLGSTLRGLVDGGLLQRTGRGHYDLALPGLDEHLRRRS